MLDETLEEGDGPQRGDLTVLGAEGDTALVEGDETAVGDADAVGMATEIEAAAQRLRPISVIRSPSRPSTSRQSHAGPAAITQKELAAIVSDVTGVRVQYEAVDAATAARQLMAAGLPEPYADLLVSFQRSAQAGQLAPVSSAVLDLTGTPPTSVRDFITAQRAALLP